MKKFPKGTALWFCVVCFYFLPLLKSGTKAQPIACSEGTTRLYGAGSESAFGAYQTIGSSYVASRSRIRVVDFAYTRLNSRKGIQMLIDNEKNGTFFAASEIVFNLTEKELYPRLMHIPVVAE